MTRRPAITSIALLLAAGCSVFYVTSPVPGVEKYDAWRVSARDGYFEHPGDRQSLRDGAVMVTFLGTTTLLFDDGTTQLLVDGFLSRPGMMHSMRVRTDAERVDGALDRAGVASQRLKAVFVSHSHYDHAMDVAHIVGRYPAVTLYGSSSTQKLGCGASTPAERYRVIGAGQEVAVGGFAVTALASSHSPHAFFEGNIDRCLVQPAWNWEYKAGQTLSFLVRHGAHTILVREGALATADHVDGAEVVFVSTGRIGKEDERFRSNYFEAALRTRPALVIPTHWDDFFAPLTPHLTFSMRMADDSSRAFDSLIARVGALDGARQAGQPPTEFRVLQGFESVVLFRPIPSPSR